jgi:adenine-specific DNA-methyltransferase
MLLEQVFPDTYRQMATIVINQKGVAQGRLSRAEEYAIFCFNRGAIIAAHDDDLLSPPDRTNSKRFQKPRWERLLRGGVDGRREDQPSLFFPVFIDSDRRAIVGVGDPLPLDQMPDLSGVPNRTVAWPIRTDGSFGRWRVSPPTLRDLMAKGYVKLGGFDEARKTWTVLYLGQKAQTQIENGVIRIASRDPDTGVVEVEYAEGDQRSIKTVWHRGTHDAGNYGSSLLRNILGEGGRFSFPKSIYAVRDAVAAVVRDRPNALIVDFFAGSGTTLNAVNLLNAADGGCRQCILVTNNEVSKDEARALTAQSLQPGHPDWEKYGICQSITFPRCKYVINGRRDDGTLLPGEYLTGRTVTKEKPRNNIRQLSFVEGRLLTLQQLKQMVALIDGIEQSKITEEQAFFIDEKSPASILFDATEAEAYLAALEEQEHITDFYIVTQENQLFKQVKREIQELVLSL